jgi:hypothetical protein
LAFLQNFVEAYDRNVTVAASPFYLDSITNTRIQITRLDLQTIALFCSNFSNRYQEAVANKFRDSRQTCDYRSGKWKLVYALINTIKYDIVCQSLSQSLSKLQAQIA